MIMITGTRPIAAERATAPRKTRVKKIDEDLLFRAVVFLILALFFGDYIV